MESQFKQGFTFDDVLIRPSSSNVEPSQVELKTTIARGFFISTPILSAAMDRVTEEKMAIKLGQLGGIGVLHRNCSPERQIQMVKNVKRMKVRAGAACGPFDVSRAVALEKAGCDLIIIDCAHGHNTNVIKSAQIIKRSLKKAKIIVGNIATKEAAEAITRFADGIKVGVGPGSICTTRVISGVGVPQFSAIMEVARVAKKRGVPVIADGGIRTSGDVAKAIAAGASAVMIGNLLAGTLEAPGKVVVRAGKKYKEYRGMGSRDVLASSYSRDRYLARGKHAVPEGVAALVPYRGAVAEVIEYLNGGLRIAMGYVGSRNIIQFQQKARFIFVTKAAVRESQPHDLSFIQE